MPDRRQQAIDRNAPDPSDGHTSESASCGSRTGRVTGRRHPEPILRLAALTCRTRVLHSALELDLFSTLAEGPLTEPELRKRLGLHERFSLDFLDALAGLGMLTKDAGRYGERLDEVERAKAVRRRRVGLGVQRSSLA
ncbi:methyltransferase family protein [Streptomyces sp. NBC_01750]|uniref:methyltransferase family protein n=1 Tax=Streptomyces sp. NBC_01750 TaxID=2975928 RepID=UPI003FA39C82